MKLILVLLSIVYALADTNEYKCAWGESYWCSDLRIAKSCSAFNHCMQTVWASQIIAADEDQTDICQYCENVITDVRGFLASNQTEKQVLQFLDNACGIIPDQQLSAQCKDIVNNYVDEVFQLIRSTLDPKTVCSALGLCSGFKDKAVHAEPQNVVSTIREYPVHKVASAASNLTCTECKAFVEEAKSIIADKTYQSVIESYLKNNLCPKLGSEADICKTLVDTYLPEVFQLLETELDPAQICKAIGFCKGSLKQRLLLATMRLQKSPLFKSAVKQGTEQCDLCKMVVTEVSDLDRNKNIQHEIEAFVKSEVCARLGALKDECDLTVDQFGPEFFELLANELDPDTLCGALGLCSTKLTAQGMIRQATSATKRKHSAISLTAAPACILCEFIMKELDGMLSSNATQSEIVQALDKVCSFLPATISKECQDFISLYGPAILDLLSQELSPQVICTSIGLCKSGVKKPHPASVAVIVKDGELCGICETVMQYIDSFLEENSTVQEIEALADKVCNFLPEGVRDQCEALIKIYGPQIIQLIAQYADPHEVCSALHLCNYTKNAVPMQKLTASKQVKPHLLGTKECTYGPAFWCENMENAVKCGAISHCKEHVWNKTQD